MALNGAMAHITKLMLSMPDGTEYHQVGFTPDYVVEYSVEDFKDAQLNKAIEEVNDYEREVLYPLAGQNIAIDLDDGVKHNYPLFGKALKKVAGLS